MTTALQPRDAGRHSLPECAEDRVGALIDHRVKLRNHVEAYWLGVTGREALNRPTLLVVSRYVEEFGADLVFRWIDRAAFVTNVGNDVVMGRYVSGIRRSLPRNLRHPSNARPEPSISDTGATPSLPSPHGMD